MMNTNNHPNYAYFCGALQSTLVSLAWDYRFRALKTDEKRREYIDQMIAECRKSAVDHENKLNASLNR